MDQIEKNAQLPFSTLKKRGGREAQPLRPLLPPASAQGKGHCLISMKSSSFNASGRATSRSSRLLSQSSISEGCIV